MTTHPRLTPEVRAKFLSLYNSQSPSAARKYLAVTLGVKRSQGNEHARAILDEAAGSSGSGVGTQDGFDIDVETSQAKTLEEVVALCKVDTDKWDAKGFSVTRKKNGFGWSARFAKRVDATDVKDEIEALKAEFKEFVGAPALQSVKDNGGEILLEVAIFDLHYGKLGWDEECGENYDSKIARKRFLAATQSLVEKATKQGKISRILFPVGNDYLHIDTQEVTTTLGTRQDADSRFSRIFRDGRKLLIEAIEYLKTIAPVDVLVVVGNHDSNSMFHLGDALECWYHADPLVKVDNAPALRKYYRYGNSIIGFTHGDKEKIKDLPLLGATEKPHDWADCAYREWHLGHRHGEHCIEEKGVKVRTLSSLSGSDFWHNNKGYVGNVKGAEAFLFHKEDGLVAQFYHNATS